MNISYVSAKVTADAEGAKKGFKEAEDAAGKFLSVTDSKIKQVSSNLNTFMAGGIGGLAGGFVGAGMMQAFDMWKNMAEKWREAKAEADSFGGSIKNMDVISRASKGHFDDWKVGLSHVQRVIAEASEGAKEARDKFALLGTTWQEMAAANPEEQLQMIGEALRNAGSHAKEVAIAREFLGKGSQSMIGQLKEAAASGGWEKATQQTELYDATLRGVQQQAAQAWKDTKQWTTEATGLALMMAQAGVQGVGHILGLAEKPKNFDEMIAEAQEKMKTAQAEAARQREQNKAVLEAQERARIEKEVTKSIETQTQELIWQRREMMFGKDSTVLMKMADAGASNKQIADFKHQQELTKDLKDQKDILEELKTPADKFAEALQRIKELGSKNMLTLDQQIEAAGKAAEKVGLIKNGEARNPTFAGASQFGTQAAMTAVQNAERQAAGLMMDKAHADAVRADAIRLQMLDELKRNNNKEPQVVNF